MQLRISRQSSARFYAARRSSALSSISTWKATRTKMRLSNFFEPSSPSRSLLENESIVTSAFGSHNVRSIAYAQALAEELGIDRSRFEFQLLYGMAGPIKRALVEMGYRVREYSPVGELLPGMAYLVRRLLENTSNEGFLRAKFAENVPAKELLRDPKELIK